jgi:hypothetical protein
VVCDKSSAAKTSAVSCICGMALGETKLPKSIVSNPTRNSDCIYATFLSVGIKGLIPCMASRGHSIILIAFMNAKYNKQIVFTKSFDAKFILHYLVIMNNITLFGNNFKYYVIW